MTNAITNNNLTSSEAPPLQSSALNGRTYTYNRALFYEFGRYLYQLVRRALSCIVSYQPEELLTRPCAQLNATTLINYFNYLETASNHTFKPILHYLHTQNAEAAQNDLRSVQFALAREFQDIRGKTHISIPIIVKGFERDHIVSLLIDTQAQKITFFDSKGLSIDHPNNARAQSIYSVANRLLRYQFEENEIRYQNRLDFYNCGAFTAMYTKNQVLQGPRVGGEMNIIEFRHNVMTKDLVKAQRLAPPQQAMS